MAQVECRYPSSRVNTFAFDAIYGEAASLRVSGA